MRYSIMLLVIVCCSSTLAAIPIPIKGAFGINLNSKLEKSINPILKSNIFTGHYQVSPKLPLNSFQQYFVDIQPSTQLIARITAVSVSASSVACENYAYDLVYILGKKYGLLDRRLDKTLHYYLTTGTRQIDVYCESRELVVEYTEHNLLKKLHEEKERYQTAETYNNL